MNTHEARTVRVERQGAVALLTLCRPDALNSINAIVAHELGIALEEVADDDTLRVAVLTGEGRAFCAGMDLMALPRGDNGSDPVNSEWGFAGFVRHFIPKPVVAAVNGLAMGGGLEIVLACDLAVASSEAIFALPEVTLGIMAGGGGVLRLPRQIPRKIAMELALTGRRITAEEAHRVGLVNSVVDRDQVVPLALALAQRIAENGAPGVEATKRLIHETFNWGSDWDDDLWSHNDEVVARLVSGADVTDGLERFAKRPRDERTLPPGL